MRVKNTAKNIVFGIGGQLVTQALNFIGRTVFIYTLGKEYLGINGLFTNILSILSLAELGVGSAIIYHMYKPLADKNNAKVAALMNLYSKFYRYIGIGIGIVGMSFVPFLDLFIKDKPDIPHLEIIYLMFLFNSMSTYFFAYKRSVISADQKEYINVLVNQKFNFVRILVQIISLVILPNYLLYLLIQIVFTWMGNIYLSNKANEMYPFLKTQGDSKLTKIEKKEIYKHVGATMSHKLGGVVVNNTDNLLISSFVGVAYVGLTSNYYMIISMLNTFIMQIFNGLTASLGNLNAAQDKEKSYEIFQKIWFMNFWIYAICSISLFNLFNPFMELWIGEEYLLSDSVVFMIIVNFFIMGMRRTTIVYNTTLGLFWHDRYKPWFEAIINLIASIILLKQWGLIGVFIGTFISTITTSFWIEPWILFKHGFNRPVITYFIKYIYYMVITIGVGLLTNYICQMIVINGLIGWIIKALVCVSISSIVLIGIFLKSKEFKYFIEIASKLRR